MFLPYILLVRIYSGMQQTQPDLSALYQSRVFTYGIVRNIFFNIPASSSNGNAFVSGAGGPKF